MEIRTLSREEAECAFAETRPRWPRPEPLPPRVDRKPGYRVARGTYVPLGGARLTLDLEGEYWRQGFPHVVGVDEAGNGAIYGPVLAAAVELDASTDLTLLADVRDCKRIASHATRQALDQQIRRVAVRCALGAASVAEVEELRDDARALAMRRALQRLGAYDGALIDGGPLTTLADARNHFLPQAESVRLAVACAAQLAQT